MIGLRVLAGIACCALLGGCSTLTLGLFAEEGPRPIRSDGPSVGNVVAQLPELALPATEAVKPTRDEVMAAYNRVYGLLPSARENHAVGKRLADLHMALGEDKDIEGEPQPYQPAVELYEKLLLQADGASAVDEILYQLARAHDLAGNVQRTRHYLDRLIGEYPASPYIGEGRFRRAELKFSAEDYRSAAADYAYVVGLGDTTPYYRNASYMLGWSEFKRSRFDEGLHQFFNVVDSVLADGDAEDLNRIDSELLEDSFRVITLALVYLDGAQTLADEMRKRGKPRWQYFAYQRLADDYFEKERFLDTVATWQTFVEHNSLDARAPAAHIGMIQTLMDAGFPSDVIPKKKAFVLRYGIYSEFWSHHPQPVRSTYLPTLHTYLSELAQLAHADAQEFDESAGDPQQRTALYLSAAQWYEELVATFPEDPRTADYLFLLGETYTEAQQPAKAVAAYQQVVRDHPEFQQAHEAGYAAILGLTALVDTSSPQELELWQRLKIDAQIEFALIFPGDPRAPAVQTDAANTLFGLGQIEQALDLAENLLHEWPDVAPPLAKTALLIIGHGYFELNDFAAAESAYHRLLALALEPQESSRVNERLLAAVYKQGEAVEASGDVDAAVQHYMRIAQIDNEAPLAAQGHFDAIALVEDAGRIGEAADMLTEFRERYPEHELGRGAGMRLAAMYEQTENWPAAANEYVGLSQHAEDKAVRRQSLYRAAEIYLLQAQPGSAIEHFRDYAHTYHEPAELRFEAMHHLDELYQQTGDAEKRAFWLRQKIQLHDDMGREVPSRVTYLAASAQMVLADAQRDQFSGLRLTHPLKRSLKKKQKALKSTLKAYERVAEYGVAEFTTASTFEIADLYSRLSRSIMTSDRPQNLSTLEMEQYDILLEEQAYPFEDQAIGLHEINMRRAWEGTYDDWVRKSYAELKRLMPGRFDKSESEVAYAHEIH